MGYTIVYVITTGKGIPIRHVLGKSKMLLGLLEGITTMLKGEVAMVTLYIIFSFFLSYLLIFAGDYAEVILSLYIESSLVFIYYDFEL